MISIKNVWKRFGNQQVLAGINLKIDGGMTTTIVGPSGVGKSVLLKLILGILPVDEGEIDINGQMITTARSEDEKNNIRSQLGVLFQSAALLDWMNVYDNIAFPLLQREVRSSIEIRDRVTEMLEALSLLPYAKKYPQEISIGIRKRVGMARALVTRPKILLVDEPNTGLDPLVGQEVYDLIRACRVRWGFTGLVISHEIPEVFQVSDRIAMILNGKIIAEGTPKFFQQSTDPAVRQFVLGLREGPIQVGLA